MAMKQMLSLFFARLALWHLGNCCHRQHENEVNAKKNVCVEINLVTCDTNGIIYTNARTS